MKIWAAIRHFFGLDQKKYHRITLSIVTQIDPTFIKWTSGKEDITSELETKAVQAINHVLNMQEITAVWDETRREVRVTYPQDLNVSFPE